MTSPYTFRCENGFYPFTNSGCGQHSIVTRVHDRYGHFSIKGLRTSAHKEMVLGLPALKDYPVICTGCMVGKQHSEELGFPVC